MKIKTTIMMILMTQLALASNLMAATGLREDSSNFLVWMFLCMCAMIVIVQLTPTIFLAVGMVKAFFKEEEQTQIEAQATGKE